MTWFRRLHGCTNMPRSYVEPQQSVQCVSAGHRSRGFQASFCNSLECSDHRSEENVYKKRKRKRRNVEGRLGEFCLHNSFCRNRETNVDPLPGCKQRVEKQKCWRTAFNKVRIASDVLQDTETESAESMSQEEEKEH